MIASHFIGATYVHAYEAPLLNCKYSLTSVAANGSMYTAIRIVARIVHIEHLNVPAKRIKSFTLEKKRRVIYFLV
jgi:hypothetical protein